MHTGRLLSASVLGVLWPSGYGRRGCRVEPWFGDDDDDWTLVAHLKTPHSVSRGSGGKGKKKNELELSKRSWKGKKNELELGKKICLQEVQLGFERGERLGVFRAEGRLFQSTGACTIAPLVGIVMAARDSETRLRRGCGGSALQLAATFCVGSKHPHPAPHPT